jgi:hypothetical protein
VRPSPKLKRRGAIAGMRCQAMSDYFSGLTDLILVVAFPGKVNMHGRRKRRRPLAQSSSMTWAEEDD